MPQVVSKPIHWLAIWSPNQGKLWYNRAIYERTWLLSPQSSDEWKEVMSMTTLEQRVQALEQEIAARKQAEEMLTIAVRALVSKEAFEKLQETIEESQEQNGRLFNVLINQGTLHNERMTNLQGQIIDLDGNMKRLQTDVKGLQAEMRETRGDMTDLKSIAQQILARLPEEP
jgi:chromosome segregation ATPase